MSDPIRTVGTATRHQEITFQDDEPVRASARRGSAPQAGRAAAPADASRAAGDTFETEPALPRSRVTSRVRALTEVGRGAIRMEVQRDNAVANAASRANLDACLAAIPERSGPSIAALRARAAGSMDDLTALRERQREAVTEMFHPTGELGVGAAEAVSTAGEGVHATAPMGMPVTVIANAARGIVAAEEVRVEATRIGADQRAVAQLRAQERRAVEQGRADAARADFSDGAQPSQIDWARMGTDPDYRQAVRDTLRRRQLTERP